MNLYVEGNIGTGKTTFLSFLKENIPNINIIYEPVDEWIEVKDSSGKNLLEHFYENQNKWSFAFQMNSFISRVNRIDSQKKQECSANIIERSVFTDKYCFAKNCHASGKMNDIEYDIYCRWHEWLCNNFDVKPTGFIYLKTDPINSYDRIKKRSRDGEEEIPLEYLTLLHNLHETWMETEKNNGVPVLIIDMTKNYNEDAEFKNELIQRVSAFIN